MRAAAATELLGEKNVHYIRVANVPRLPLGLYRGAM